jgi:hypothetical protein
MLGAIPALPQYAFMAWCSVTKHRVNFNFHLYLQVVKLQMNGKSVMAYIKLVFRVLTVPFGVNS